MSNDQSGERPSAPGANADTGAFALPPRVSSRELLHQSRELLIEHDGREYRLRLTRQGKLILTA